MRWFLLVVGFVLTFAGVATLITVPTLSYTQVFGLICLMVLGVGIMAFGEEQ